jgi:hypothetical protein
MTETQIFWLSAFADELAKLSKNFKDGDDICSKQVLNVLRQIEKYIKRYPNPRDAARAMEERLSLLSLSRSRSLVQSHERRECIRASAL